MWGKPQRFAAAFSSCSQLTTSAEHLAKLRTAGKATIAAYGRPG